MASKTKKKAAKKKTAIKRKAAAKKKPIKRKMGRPSSYSKAIDGKICEKLAAGQSLSKICKLKGMPSTVTVFNWLSARPDFLDRYARAREAQADYHVDGMIDLAHGAPENVAGVAKARLEIDTIKWVAGKQRPEKYGDKIAQEISGPGGGPIQTQDMTQDAALAVINDLAGKAAQQDDDGSTSDT